MKKFGLDADVANNGVEAINHLRETDYDIVLMDCQMPIMDGYQASETIRKQDCGVINPGVPIVAMTANAMQGDREKCIAAGMNDYIAKPVVPEKLQQALQAWLPESCHADGSEPANQQDAADVAEKNTVDQSDEPVFNYEALSARMMHDQDLIKMVAEEFVVDIKDQVELLFKAVQDADLENIRLQAHSIKGAAANMAGTALSSRAYTMEKASKAGNLDVIIENMPQLEKDYQALVEAVNQKLFSDS